jgi:hypothetical protein
MKYLGDFVDLVVLGNGLVAEMGGVGHSAVPVGFAEFVDALYKRHAWGERAGGGRWGKRLRISLLFST